MPDNEPAWADVFKGTTTAIGVVTAFLTAAGITTGFAMRMLRNDTGPLIAGLIAMLAGVIGAALLYQVNKYGWAVFVLLFFGALVELTYVAKWASQAQERPHLVASAETMTTGLVKVTTTVKAEGLQTDDLIHVVAQGYIRAPMDPLKEERTVKKISRWVVHESAFGPKADGSVEGTSTFEVSPALFADLVIMASRHREVVRADSGPCIPAELRPPAAAPASGSNPAPVPPAPPTNPVPVPPTPAPGSNPVPTPGRDSHKSAQGCVRFLLPRANKRPVVSASISAGSNENADRILTATVSAGGVPPLSVVIVRAWFRTERQIESLMNQALGPDLAGNIKTLIAVPLKKGGSREACVVAFLPSDDAPANVNEDMCKAETTLPEHVGRAVVGGTWK